MAYTRYYRDITVQNNESEDLTDYQVCIEISDADFFIKADPNNLVIIDGDTTLSYWVETWKRPDSKARIWTKVNLPASGSKTIKLCYGGYVDWINQNGDDVFELFDDFEGETLDTSKWVLWLELADASYEIADSHLIIHAGTGGSTLKSSTVFGKGYCFSSFIRTNGQNVNLIKLEYKEGSSYTNYTTYELDNSDHYSGIYDTLRLVSYLDGEFAATDYSNRDSVLHTNKSYKIYRYPDGSTYGYQSHQLLGNFNSVVIDGLMSCGVGSWSASSSRDLYVDYIYVTKLVQNEPTITISAETEETRYWLQSPAGMLAGQVCDKNGNIITGTSVDVIVLNKDTKEIENVTASNAEDGTWQTEVQSGKKLVVFALEGTYEEDTDIAGAEFLEVE